MTHTTNYNLNKFEATDRVTRDGFNDNADAIDAALKSVSDAAASAQSTAASAAATAATALGTAMAAGNVTLHHITRVGTGTADPVTVTIPEGKPMVIFASEPDGDRRMIGWRPCAKTQSIQSSPLTFTLGWGDHSVTWNNNHAYNTNLNTVGVQYSIIILAVPD